MKVKIPVTFFRVTHPSPFSPTTIPASGIDELKQYLKSASISHTSIKELV